MDFPYSALPVTESSSLDALVRANAEALERKYAELCHAVVAGRCLPSRGEQCGAALQVLRQLVAFMDTGSTEISAPEVAESH